MRIIKTFKPARSSIAKKVFNRLLLNLRLTRFPKKLLRQREILLTTPPANNHTPWQTQSPILADIIALVKSPYKNEPRSNTQMNLPLSKIIKIIKSEKVSIFPETWKGFRLVITFTRKQWDWKRRNKPCQSLKYKHVSNHCRNLKLL